MKPSGIVTITTDFGHKGPFVAVMKGVILGRFPAAKICGHNQTKATECPGLDLPMALIDAPSFGDVQTGYCLGQFFADGGQLVHCVESDDASLYLQGAPAPGQDVWLAFGVQTPEAGICWAPTPHRPTCLRSQTIRQRAVHPQMRSSPATRIPKRSTPQPKHPSSSVTT